MDSIWNIKKWSYWWTDHRRTDYPQKDWNDYIGPFWKTGVNQISYLIFKEDLHVPSSPNLDPSRLWVLSFLNVPECSNQTPIQQPLSKISQKYPKFYLFWIVWNGSKSFLDMLLYSTFFLKVFMCKGAQREAQYLAFTQVFCTNHAQKLHEIHVHAKFTQSRWMPDWSITQ